MGGYEDVQRSAFREEVERGTYNPDFQHPESSRRFFREVFEDVFARMPRRPLDILEVGCGNGVWLELLKNWRPDCNYYGFDLTPEMIDLARQRFGASVTLGVGDATVAADYEFGIPKKRFDLVFAYGVIHQLPRSLQEAGLDQAWAHVAPGGALVLFDHERWSRYGLLMATKKWVTRNTPVALVPMFYTNARYPSLRQFRSKLARNGEAHVRVARDGPMRALIAWPR
jgi:SAM-dependent methyltransferase